MSQDSDGEELRARRQLFRYVTADLATEYLAVMDLFTDSLLADLSASDIHERLARAGLTLTPEDVEARCDQLLAWGNLVKSVRDTRVTTIAAYLRSRARYQPSKLGGMVHRQVRDLMAEANGVREVARELLGGMSDTLAAIVRAAQARDARDDQLAADVSTLFASHQLFADSVSEFYGYLPTVLTRYDLAGEDYATFKTLLVDYVHLVSADVSRHAPTIARLLSDLDEHLEYVLTTLAPTAALQNVDGSAAKRSPGRVRTDWDALNAYYRAQDGRSKPDELRKATELALNQLLANAKRMLAAAGTGVSRHADLLRLARWFAIAGDGDAHAIFDAVFGMYPARHVSSGPEEGDTGSAGTSWWVSDPVDVPVSLRERGDRTARGRSSPVPDPGLEAVRLQMDADQEAADRAAASGELTSAGDLDGARLSPAARDILLELLASALAVGAMPDLDGDVIVTTDPDLGVDLHVRATPGASTQTVSPDGVLRIDDVALSVHPAGSSVGAVERNEAVNS